MTDDIVAVLADVRAMVTAAERADAQAEVWRVNSADPAQRHLAGLIRADAERARALLAALEAAVKKRQR
jgi:hypothetical protein